MNFAKPGPKSTKGPIPNLPEMVSLSTSVLPISCIYGVGSFISPDF